MPSKTTVNWLFNDIWCYLFIACSDQKISVLGETAVRVYYILLIYEFHYDYIKNKCGNKSKLLFTDTDGLMYEIETEDIYKDFSSDKEMFDFINYLTKSKCSDDSNKLIMGKMKDETGSVLQLKNL